jgi:hypothetical protein
MKNAFEVKYGRCFSHFNTSRRGLKVSNLIMRENWGVNLSPKDKALTKKSLKVSLGKPYFLDWATRTLGMWTEPSIFAWIIITTGNSSEMTMKKSSR